jgi:hypothetical protein
MNLINLTYGGSRSYFKGIIEQGNKLATVEAGWSSYCRLLVATRLNMKLVIGGVEEDVIDGRTLLDLTFNTAKAGKFTLDEAEAIASQLDKISLRYTSVRTPFFAIAYDVTEVAVEKDLTSDKEASNMDSVAEASTLVEPPKQRGRKAVAK